MFLALEELQKSLKYHRRQLEDNLRQIEIKEEAVELLKQKNKQHEQTIDELNIAIEKIKEVAESE